MDSLASCFIFTIKLVFFFFRSANEEKIRCHLAMIVNAALLPCYFCHRLPLIKSIYLWMRSVTTFSFLWSWLPRAAAFSQFFLHLMFICAHKYLIWVGRRHLCRWTECVGPIFTDQIAKNSYFFFSSCIVHTWRSHLSHIVHDDASSGWTVKCVRFHRNK